MAYRTGQLTQRITLERDIRVSDGMGGSTVSPIAFARVYAYYRKKSLKETLQGQQIQATGSGIFVIRNRKDLLPSDRIVLVSSGQRFNIRGLPPYDSRETFIEIEVEHGVAN